MLIEEVKKDSRINIRVMRKADLGTSICSRWHFSLYDLDFDLFVLVVLRLIRQLATIYYYHI